MPARLSPGWIGQIDSVLLTGLSTATNAAIVAGDSILAAFGKLQAQLANYLPLTGGTLTGPLTTNATFIGTIDADATGINATAIGVTTPAAGYFTNIPAASDNGRNKLHNGQFRVLQRGVGPFSANNAYTADRWQLQLVGDTNAVTYPALNDSARISIGDEAASVQLQNVVTGAATAANYSQLVQKIEDVRRTAGRTVTVSFYAVGSLPRLAVRLIQFFGTGGSTSVSIAPQSVALTAAWVRYKLTFTLPGLNGKTLGGGNDALWFCFGFSSGTTNAALIGVGAQSGSVGVWGVQLETGAYATPVEMLPLAADLENCQRQYQSGVFVQGGYATGGAVNTASAFAVTMRAAPTVAIANNGSSNINGTPTTNGTVSGASLVGDTSFIGTYLLSYTFTASAEL